MQIPSDNCPFNERPDMKAAEITAAGHEALRSGKFGMVRINYANPDMVPPPPSSLPDFCEFWEISPPLPPTAASFQFQKQLFVGGTTYLTFRNPPGTHPST